jgi:hypothetical protein
VIETIHVRKIGAIWFAWPKTPAGTQAAIAHDDERLDAVGKLIDRMLARGFVLADSVGITTDESLPAPRTSDEAIARAINPTTRITAADLRRAAHEFSKIETRVRGKLAAQERDRHYVTDPLISLTIAAAPLIDWLRSGAAWARRECREFFSWRRVR